MRTDKRLNEPLLFAFAARGAHSIGNRLFLFEAAQMSESEIRDFLLKNNITDRELQDRYIEFVQMYRIASS